MLLHYASMGEAEGVEMLSMNCELITANMQADRWRALVNKTRNVFSGLITNAPNGHGHQFLVTWWDAVDVIGVDLYDFINGSTVEEMVQSWGPFVDMLEGLHTNYSKPVALTEIGYCSGGCDRSSSSSNQDLIQQAYHYEALFLATVNATKDGWFLGAFFWNWDTDPAYGPGDVCLSPQWKPSEDVLRRYYRATEPRPAIPPFPPMCIGAGTCTA